MSRIFWDTNLFLYLFEEYGTFRREPGQSARECSSVGINS